MALVKFDMDAMTKKLMDKADRGLRAGAELLRSKVIDNITNQEGTTSSPGEYPSKQTGNLANSINVSRRRVGRRLTYTVTADASYADHVEKVRPFLSRTAEENRDAIEDEIKRSI